MTAGRYISPDRRRHCKMNNSREEFGIAAWHGPLPDSGLGRDSIRPKAGHSMMQCGHSTHAAPAPQAPSAPPGRHGHPPPHEPGRKPTGRTSRLEPPANGPYRSRSGYSEKQCRPLSRSPRERRPEDRTTDATRTAVLETQFRGRSQGLLYNTVRPHSALGYRPPAPQTFAPARNHLDDILPMQ